jgi:hypothetical protein
MNIQQYYNTAIKVADEVLKDPIHGANEILKIKFGYEKGVKGFFSDPFNILLLPQPILLLVRLTYKYLRNNQKRQLEMEIMKREIIAKQQSIIKRMEEEQEMNEQKVQNLQETVEFLEEALKRIEKEKDK